MIIPNKIKESTLKKLNLLLKCYLIKTFETDGYDPGAELANVARSKRAKMIIVTINKIHQNEEIEKEKLDKLFDMYKTYYNKNEEL